MLGPYKHGEHSKCEPYDSNTLLRAFRCMTHDQTYPRLPCLRRLSYQLLAMMHVTCHDACTKIIHDYIACVGCQTSGTLHATRCCETPCRRWWSLLDRNFAPMFCCCFLRDNNNKACIFIKDGMLNRIQLLDCCCAVLFV
jgi:hypothetical protein